MQQLGTRFDSPDCIRSDPGPSRADDRQYIIFTANEHIPREIMTFFVIRMPQFAV